LKSPHRVTLHAHPARPCTAVSAIEVELAATDSGGLNLRYRAHSKPDAICLPAAMPPGPADNLWQHTCCELFIAEQALETADSTVNRKNYLEFNFSPSGQWAAYRFTDYRVRDTGFAPAAAPHISLHRLDDGFQLDVSLPPELIPDGPKLALGLTAVIEDMAGAKTYWAVQHCAAQPDFHLRQSFALDLNRNTP
jgi:hypothetical protein